MDVFTLQQRGSKPWRRRLSDTVLSVLQSELAGKNISFGVEAGYYLICLDTLNLVGAFSFNF